MRKIFFFLLLSFQALTFASHPFDEEANGLPFFTPNWTPENQPPNFWFPQQFNHDDGYWNAIAPDPGYGVPTMPSYIYSYVPYSDDTLPYYEDPMFNAGIADGSLPVQKPLIPYGQSCEYPYQEAQYIPAPPAPKRPFDDSLDSEIKSTQLIQSKKQKREMGSQSTEKPDSKIPSPARVYPLELKDVTERHAMQLVEADIEERKHARQLLYRRFATMDSETRMNISVCTAYKFTCQKMNTLYIAVGEIPLEDILGKFKKYLAGEGINIQSFKAHNRLNVQKKNSITESYASGQTSILISRQSLLQRNYFDVPNVGLIIVDEGNVFQASVHYLIKQNFPDAYILWFKSTIYGNNLKRLEGIPIRHN